MRERRDKRERRVMRDKREERMEREGLCHGWMTDAFSLVLTLTVDSVALSKLARQSTMCTHVECSIAYVHRSAFMIRIVGDNFPALNVGVKETSKDGNEKAIRGGIHQESSPVLVVARLKLT